MNEREAIALEMQELKEQGRLDWEMYFELRRHRNQRYNELQDRLRQIDERDSRIEWEREHQPPVIPPPPEEKRHFKLTPRVKGEEPEELPKPKNLDIEPEELKLKRYEEEEEEPEGEPVSLAEIKREKEKPTYSEGVEKICEYLKEKEGEWVAFNLIERYAEAQLNYKYTNFSNVLRRAISLVPEIKVQKITARQFLYTWKTDL